MAKNLRKPKTGVKNPAAAALLLSFGCGVGVCILLLALAAFLLTHTGLPLSAVRPMACMAAAVGAAVSAAVAAGLFSKSKKSLFHVQLSFPSVISRFRHTVNRLPAPAVLSTESSPP